MTRDKIVSAPGHGGERCRVSIIIVSWNTRDLLRDCVAGTLAACEEIRGGTELVVIDNASQDSSAEMVRDEFPSVRVIENGSNDGFARACNQGIRESTGEYVLLLNPDTTATHPFLNVLVEFLDRNPDAGAAGPRLVDRAGETQVSCFPLPTLAREFWRLFHLDRLHPYAVYPPERWGTRRAQIVDTVQGACMLIRRSALEDAGLIDESFFVYTEEIDLCRRLLDLGWKIYWIPEAVVTHYGGQSTRQVSSRMFLQLYRSKVQYFRKHFGMLGAVAYKAVLLAAIVPRVTVPPLLALVVPSRRDRLAPLSRNYRSLLMELHGL